MEYKYGDVTSTVIGAAMEVHNILRNGYQEVIYQRALAMELGNRNIAFEREVKIPIYYKGLLIGSRRVDFLIDKTICIEIKAVTRLEDAHLTQALNYLECFNLEIGMLINFGHTSLEFKRLFNKKYNPVRANEQISK